MQYWWSPTITAQDITNDLEAIEEQGIGGVLIFDTIAPTRSRGGLLKHALVEAQRLGLIVNICPQGPFQMAGDWISPEHALKTPVWAQADVAGPRPQFRINTLPQGRDGFYRDVALLAYKLRPEIRRPANHIRRAGGKLTGSSSVINPEYSVDDNPLTAAVINSIRQSSRPITLPGDPYQDPKWITCEFPKPYTASAVSVCVANHIDFPTELELHSSDDGEQYQLICRWQARVDEPLPVEFTETCARFYRLVATNDNRSELRPFIEVRLFDLFNKGESIGWTRIDHWMLRTGQGMGIPWYDPEVLERDATNVPAELADVAAENVMDLTEYIRDDGVAVWNVPPGDWHILRFGYTVAAPFLDDFPARFCDFLSKESTRAAFDGLPTTYLQEFSAHIGKALVYMHEDSWELEQNSFWTGGFVDEFKHRRGYDPRPYLPAIT